MKGLGFSCFTRGFLLHCKLYIRGRRGQSGIESNCWDVMSWKAEGMTREDWPPAVFFFQLWTMVLNKFSLPFSSHFPSSMLRLTWLPSWKLWGHYVYYVYTCSTLKVLSRSAKSLAQEDDTGWHCSKAVLRVKVATSQQRPKHIPLECLFILGWKAHLKHILWCLLAGARCVQPLVLPVGNSQQLRSAQFTFLPSTINHGPTVTRAEHCSLKSEENLNKHKSSEKHGLRQNTSLAFDQHPARTNLFSCREKNLQLFKLLGFQSPSIQAPEHEGAYKMAIKFYLQAMCQKLRDRGKIKSAFCKVSGQWAMRANVVLCHVLRISGVWGIAVRDGLTSSQTPPSYLHYGYGRYLQEGSFTGKLQDIRGMGIPQIHPTTWEGIAGGCCWCWLLGQGREDPVSLLQWTEAIPSSAFSCLCMLKDGHSNISMALFQASQGFPCSWSTDTKGEKLFIFLLYPTSFSSPYWHLGQMQAVRRRPLEMYCFRKHLKNLYIILVNPKTPWSYTDVNRAILLLGEVGSHSMPKEVANEERKKL